jgi:hypothetical protein
MDEARTDDIPQVSMEENALLTAEYTEEEVKNATFSKWNTTKHQVWMVFELKFYQIFWDTIKSDLLDLFSYLHAGQLELSRINYTVADHVVWPSQTSFMQGRTSSMKS